MTSPVPTHHREGASAKRVLYLSYDGMTDPLGQSQVLPYLTRLAAHGYRIDLVSCEKPERLVTFRADVDEIAGAAGIAWHPIPYTKRPPVVSTVLDVRRMRRTALRLHRADPFDVVHCRSYVPSLIGVELRRRWRVPFVFDMRGFWADEKVDAGSWSLRNPLFRAVYSYFKRAEADFVAHADAIVSLTESGRAEMLRWESYGGSRAPIDIIPCSVDFELFRPAGPESRRAVRQALGIEQDAPVLGYVGSVGGWYMLEEMLDLFAALWTRRPNARFLLLTPAEPEPIRARASGRGVDPDSLIIRFARRRELVELLAAVDVGVCFIRPSYSKKSSSPTKLGEYLAMGIPVVANSGVGDVEEVMRFVNGGIVVDDFSPRTYAAVAEQFETLAALDGQAIRTRARMLFDVDAAAARYLAIYERLTGRTGADGRSVE